VAFNFTGLRTKPEQRAIRTRDYENGIFDDLFGDFLSSLPSTSLYSSSDLDISPRVDISENDNSYLLEAELPGLKENEIDVKIDNNILTIKGRKEKVSEEKNKNYYLKERYSGSFQRSISLPNNIDEEGIDANFENGILRIEIPKKNQKTVKKIEIGSQKK